MIKISTIVVTYRRDAALRETLLRLAAIAGQRPDHELVLVDNNADGLLRTAGDAFANFQAVTLTSNRGVAGGRNAGIRAAKGEILVFLDDDALVLSDDIFDRIETLFDCRQDLAAIAFRSLERDRDVTPDIEFPHTDKSLDKGRAFDTFRFIGVGHAIRASALAKTGLYREEFFYGMEEFDLSFRFLKHGFRVRYEPEIVVRHMKDPAGRLPSREKIENSILNKARIAWMHLPAHLAAINVIAWFIWGAIASRGRARLHRVAHQAVSWAVTNSTLRAPLSEPLVAEIRAMGGSPWR